MADDTQSTFQDILKEISAVNVSLQRISINTEIAAEAAIDAIKPKDTRDFEKGSIECLRAIYNFLDQEGLGPQMQFNLSMLIPIKHTLDRMNDRVKLMMEDLAQLLVNTTESFENNGMADKEKAKAYLKFQKQFDEILETNQQQRDTLAEMYKLEEERAKEKKLNDLGLLGWAAAIGAALAGMITGFIAEIVKIGKSLYAMIKKIFNLDKLFAKLKSINIGEAFASAIEAIKNFGGKIAARIESIVSSFKESEFGKSLISAFESVKNFVSKIGKNIAEDFEEFMNAVKNSPLAEDIKAVIDGIKKFGSSLVEDVKAFIEAAKNSQLAEDLKIVVSKIKSIGSDIAESFTKSVEAISEGFKAFGAQIKEMYTAVKTFLTEGEWIKDIVSAFKAVGQEFGKLKKLFSTLEEGEEAVGIFGKIFGPLMEWFGKLKFIAEKFFSFGKVFGELLGKLALPLTIIMSAWDAITGFIDGFKNTQGDLGDKIIGGLKAGFSKVVDGLVGGLLDLLKNAVSWIAGKLGFSNVQKALDSFSFSDILTKIIGNTIDAIVGYFKDMFGGIPKMFDDFKKMITGKGNFVDLLKDVLAALIRTLLAPVQFLAKVAGFDITKKALTMLGLPTGDEKGASSAAPASTTSPEASNVTATPAPATTPDASNVTATPAPATTPDASNVTAAPTDAELNKIGIPMGQTALDQIAPASTPTTGAEINAMQSDTANANAAASTPAPAPSPDQKHSGTTNNSSSITYNTNNVPDRTSWMMTPSYAGF